MSKFDHVISFVKNLYPGKEFIPLHEPYFGGNEKEYVMDTIDSTFVSSVGPYVDKFEAMMRDYTGAKHAVAVVNGTAALHMSLILADVKQGDLVITQALSFIATCNAISYIGAEPYFVDIDKKSLSLDVDSLSGFLSQLEMRNGTAYHKKSGRRIGACVPMHTFGFPAKIDEIVELCNTFNIPVIEDAAESIGALYKGTHTGRFGKLGTFSFNGNKTITCGGGGIIVTDDERLGKFAKHLTTQSKIPHRWEFDHDNVGYNYRCPNINSALACAQLEQLDSFIENKRDTARRYDEFFKRTDVEFLTEPEYSRSNYWLNSILLEDRNERDSFLEVTNSNGVMTRPVWKLMSKVAMFQGCGRERLENSEWVEERLVNLPSSVRK